tara:strand:+ start:2737 stop:3000 length:264 start_codon:yes stop_codon:yes gene_type:complete
MKNYIYKIIIFIIATIIIFEFTIGKHINQFNEKVEHFTTKEGRKEIVSSLKKEIRKANEKENYLDDEERVLLRNFIIKIKEELQLEN